MTNEDIKKILIGAAIATGGALISYVTTVLPGIAEQYPMIGPIITVVASVGINAARKWLASLNG